MFHKCFEDPGEDRIEIIENTPEARDRFGENYGAFEFKLNRDQIKSLLEGKVVAFDINGREYSGFLSLRGDGLKQGEDTDWSS